MTALPPGAFRPYGSPVGRAPRAHCPCFWDWLAKTEKVVGLMVSLLLLALLGYKLGLVIV